MINTTISHTILNFKCGTFNVCGFFYVPGYYHISPHYFYFTQIPTLQIIARYIYILSLTHIYIYIFINHVSLVLLTTSKSTQIHKWTCFLNICPTSMQNLLSNFMHSCMNSLQFDQVKLQYLH